MGQRSSKPKNSYNVAPVADKPQQSATPASIEIDDTKTKSKVVPAAPVEAAKATPAPTPQIVNNELVPKWINESLFVEILKENEPEFSKIQSFRLKPALGAGENYATLMLRVSIEVELTDKSIKPVSYMLKVPHDSPEMEQMLQVANFFTVENEAYMNFVPKLEELYKSKGLDITIAPRAYQFKESLKQEPKLANTVLMYDLGQDGYKNVNRVDCLNLEQSKLVLRKMAQYHAASAHYKSVHGPYPDILLYGMFGSDIEKAMAMMEAMMGPTQKLFLNNLKNYKDCEKYHDKLELFFSKFRDMFLTAKPDPNEFNVINHGDSWVNNLLFNIGHNGELIDMLFVDFQNPRYGHPSADLLYFIMTSVHIDHKLKDFDYLIKYYHDQLIEHLQLLGYTERMPKLREFQMEMYKYGSWAVTASFLVLPLVLLDPTESATFENFLGNSEGGNDFKNLMYTNKRYQMYIEQILPWLDNRGLLEAYEPTQGQGAIQSPVATQIQVNIAKSAETEVDSSVPEWVNSDYFKDLLEAEHADFKEIQKCCVKKATEAGDNYASIMLSVDIDYQTTSDQSSNVAYMLKVPPNGSASKAILDLMLTYKKELAMYEDVIPQLEEIYQQAGQTIIFSPKSYKLKNAPDCEHLLLQNLRTAGYKNADRLQGLSQTETEHVLTKLAKLHAASAQLYVTKGAYADCLDKPLHTEATRAIYESPETKSFYDTFNESVKTYKGNELFADKLAYYMDHSFDLTAQAQQYDKNQFNCINHGDCWTNNVMFAYDAQGQIKDTLLIDYQRSCFGTPALDLYYFLLSSPSFDIKIAKFDYFVRYYHGELQRNLELLKYPRHIPTLKELHTTLLNNPLWAVSTVSSVMSAVLLDPTDNASIETMMGTDAEAKEFKKKLFQNDRYRKHAEALYPWLNHRGLLDFDNISAKTKENCDLGVDWLNLNDFCEIIGAEEPQFEKILGGTSASATKPGDNYASKLLKLDIDVQLKDNSQKTYSYMLKVQYGEEAITSSFNMFPKEMEMYGKFVPAFEQLYQNAGLSITFSPKSYRLNKLIKQEYLLMENLQASGFSMIDRIQGLDLEHTKSVLKKLAQWHAASLSYKELNGPYPSSYNNGIINMETREMFKSIMERSKQGFLKIMACFKDAEEYQHKLETIFNVYVDKFIESDQIDEQEFNVLNHGDIWINNIMFQHDTNGQVQQTYLIDHQVTKYGNPAQDLFYLLMTSTQLDIKIDQFDYLIRWYHENLTEHAKILKYTGFMPDLKELHLILLKHPILACGTALGTLTLCLMEVKAELATELFMEDSPAADALYSEVYSNDRYRAHFERIMSWLNRRGLLDFVYRIKTEVGLN